MIATSDVGVSYKIYDSGGRFGVLGANDALRHHSYDSSAIYGFANAGRGSNPSLNTDVEVSVNFYNDKKIYKDNVFADTCSTATFNTDMNYYLFARNYRTEGSVNPYWTGRVYYFKITNGSTLVRNFIPAKRNSDNAIGLYDTVNGVFYTNAGTGTFIAGPAV